MFNLCNKSSSCGNIKSFSTVWSRCAPRLCSWPLLFLVYINDLDRNIKSNVKFFADYAMLFPIVTNPEISANDLNHDLDVIHQWVHQWKLEFNPDPTKQASEILVSSDISNPNHPQLMFNGTVVTKMNGKIFRPHLIWAYLLKKHLWKNH